MANKTEKDLRAHLSLFDPEYPIKKGFVAQLLLDRTEASVLAEIKNIVQAAESKKRPNEEILLTNLNNLKSALKDKQCHLTKEWPSLIRLCLQPFPITFRSIFEPETPDQQADMLKLSSTVSELACPAAAGPDISELIQSGITFTSAKLSSVSATCCSTLSQKLKKDCEHCKCCISQQGHSSSILE